jgi:hypothetical protein
VAEAPSRREGPVTAPPRATAGPPASAAVAEAISTGASRPPPQGPPTGPAPAGHGLGLPLGFHLNGRFDLAYERRGLGRDAGWEEGRDAVRSYHQLLFLTRPADARVPVGVSVEILGLQIWEATYARGFDGLGASLIVRGGKLLVPFGADPLFHQLYGGLAGFDQRVLPPVWAQEGLAEQLVARLGPVSVASDLYVVRGYRQKTPDSVLNLQNDISPLDEAKIGVGHRLGVSWRRLAGWYSIYVNPLGGGRRLVLQAADLTTGRRRDVAVLGRLSAAVGLLRADVSGGGAGRDYYHFASYAQVRVHATDGLYLQYRQGLRTFNNRRGVILDQTRLEATDGSTHAVGVAGRWRYLSGGVHYVWNLEKADETDDDFLRAAVALEF